ncbi:hypothetical protein F5146DRAFT_1161148 [Armillaria mellea]|nr:hypothetical protein F5146DRAFT_1161148 [Armillaria mellea]
MNLYQTSSGMLNNSYANESGQVIYKVSTPNKFSRRVTTISRILPPEHPPREDTDLRGARSEEVDFQDRFVTLGYIDWKVFVSSVLRFNGTEVKATEYLRKQGWGFYGRNRVFTGPDGKEYKWILGASISKLVLNDKSETLIAKYHTRKLGLFSPAKARPAYLEITPEGVHMVDDIFFTFIYIEKLRQEEERNTAASSGA